MCKNKITIKECINFKIEQLETLKLQYFKCLEVTINYIKKLFCICDTLIFDTVNDFFLM